MIYPALIRTALGLIALTWSTNAFAHIGHHDQLTSFELVHHFLKEPSHLIISFLVLVGLSITVCCLSLYGWKNIGDPFRSANSVANDICHSTDTHRS